jgi:GMP synthase (glutamine-hydrolysing)
MSSRIRYLLLQIRDATDPMRNQEIECFGRTLPCEVSQIAVHDLLTGEPSRATLDAATIVLLGGSGDYSAAGEGAWLDRALDALRTLHELSKPTFASCWGFQAMARAMGGDVIHDLSRAELGTRPVHLTREGINDVVFGQLRSPFLCQMGHEDRVARLPEDAIRLAFTDRVDNQAFRFANRPIYCTQFHPELDRQAILQRVEAYPKYIRKIADVSIEEFTASIQETPEANRLLPHFVRHVLREW